MKAKKKAARSAKKKPAPGITRGPSKKALRRPGEKWEQDPPRLITVKELAELCGMSDDTIRNMMREPNAPRVVGTKLPREPWLQYVQLRKLYGPKALKLMSPEEAHAAVTGSVSPAGIEPRGAPTPRPVGSGGDEAGEPGDETGNVITATELLRLNPGQLIKRKMAEELITRRLANQERKRRLIPRAEVEECIFSRAQIAISYKRQICLELPPKLLGLDRPEMEARIREALDELFRRIATIGDPISAPAGHTAEPAVTGSSPADADAKTPSI